MRKSILFVLMVMVLFVVSVMPVAAHDAPGMASGPVDAAMSKLRHTADVLVYW